ncbi:ABC transporter substrate-binding protein [Ornithinibacillus sp. 4-3]|uniref:ABC transporter substrate-binding protein n=1 Tax=Ornithinibacillus sp. 4-3 TaxID=3231488 RepID=A0AB39HMN6_9BACI
MRWIKFGFLIVMLFMLWGCQSEKSSDNDIRGEVKGDLKIALPSEPPTLDTHLNTTTISTLVARNIFESLVAPDSNYDVQPMLAESFELLDDGKTIEFKLRQGVKFHNGEEMKAFDVVASMNRWIESSGTGKSTFEGAEFVEIDDYTVELQMIHPTSTALIVLAYSGGEFPSIMPASIIEASDGGMVDEYIGTGPYEFEEWKQNNYILLKKYEEYATREEPADGLAGKREVFVENLYALIVPDSSTRVAGILSGEYDAVIDVPIDSTEQINANSDVVLESTPRDVFNLYFNKKEGLFANKIAREALAVGINKEDMLKAAFINPDYYNMTHHMMLANQESQWYSDIGKDQYDFQDEELAKELFAEAGYDGEELKIITSKDYDHMYNAAIVLQEQLNKLGIASHIEVYDWPTFTDIRNDPSKWDLTIIANTSKVEPTSLVFMRSDFAGWTEDPELDELAEKLRRAPSMDEARQVYDELQSWFLDYRPVIKIGDGNLLYASRKSISPIEDVDGAIFWNVSKTE